MLVLNFIDNCCENCVGPSTQRKKFPKQYTNLAEDPAHAAIVEEYKAKLLAKLEAVRTNDLDINYK